MLNIIEGDNINGYLYAEVKYLAHRCAEVKRGLFNCKRTFSYSGSTFTCSIYASLHPFLNPFDDVILNMKS